MDKESKDGLRVFKQCLKYMDVEKWKLSLEPEETKTLNQTKKFIPKKIIGATMTIEFKRKGGK